MFSTFKSHVKEHLRTESEHVYPIDLVVGQAERYNAVYWSWIILESADYNHLTPGSIIQPEFSFNEPNGVFDKFVSIAENSSPDARVSIFIEMPEDICSFEPTALLTMVDYSDANASPTFPEAYQAGQRDYPDPHPHQAHSTQKQLLAADHLPPPKRREVVGSL
ncbi:hypothetical protein PTTG_08154, partial [Puccinia triticina 1-1 BBBD Race 1]